MKTYKDDVKALARLCRKCNGLCCNGTSITSSKAELNKLKDRYIFDKKALKTPYGWINTIKVKKYRACPFLGVKSEKIGCILNEKQKPLSCRLFPLTFILEKNKPKFYISMYCLYYYDVSKLDKWIKKSIKDADKELKSWKKSERASASYIHSNVYKNKTNLLEIE